MVLPPISRRNSSDPHFTGNGDIVCVDEFWVGAAANAQNLSRHALQVS